MRLLSKEEIKDARPTPLDCGRCERGGDECKLTELDKARCWARMSAKAQAKLTESDTLKKVGAYISERRLAYRGTPQQMFVMTDQALQSLLRGEKPEDLCLHQWKSETC